MQPESSEDSWEETKDSPSTIPGVMGAGYILSTLPTATMPRSPLGKQRMKEERRPRSKKRQSPRAS